MPCLLIGYFDILLDRQKNQNSRGGRKKPTGFQASLPACQQRPRKGVGPFSLSLLERNWTELALDSGNLTWKPIGLALAWKQRKCPIQAIYLYGR